MKPLGRRAYGSIPHLPGSRRGPADRGITESQARIAIHKARDRNDRVIVEEKLDGSCVAVALTASKILPLSRAGYMAYTSPYKQHHLFYEWAIKNEHRFSDVLKEGEWLCGEWLAQAHGTRYDLADREPFVAFDLMKDGVRATRDEFWQRVYPTFAVPTDINNGPPMAIDDAMSSLGDHGYYGALDPVEGAVWRVERNGKVDFLCKYVRCDKEDGCYLSEESPIWNWLPKDP